MKIPVAERAEYIRVIMAELSRIQNHLVFIGMLMNDLGTMYTPSLYAFEERELVLDIFEAVSGARMMCNYFRFGGVVRDIPEDALQKIKDLVHERLPAKTDEMERFLNENEVLVCAFERHSRDQRGRRHQILGHGSCPARRRRALRLAPRRPVFHLRPLRLRCGGPLQRRHDG
jgi:hypothetical protein